MQHMLSAVLGRTFSIFSARYENLPLSIFFLAVVISFSDFMLLTSFVNESSS
jgi:hypothetical protein